MKIMNLAALATLLGTLTFMSCTKPTDPNTTGNLTLNLSNLEDLGNDYAYEGWIMVNGAPQSTGTFRVDATGTLSQTNFEVDQAALDQATAFILTKEPSPDSAPAPSAVKILAGDFNGGDATLRVDDSRALGTDFGSATGRYILATPTDGNSQDETSGAWFLDNSTGSPVAGLSLPTLPAGWQYEGWAVINGTPVTTGTFTDPAAADASAPFSGTVAAGPAFPGEDFIQNAPAGLTFPLDLSSQKIVVSVEPVPDNSPAPFLLKPLVGDVPANATDRTVYTLLNNATATNPTGSISR